MSIHSSSNGFDQCSAPPSTTIEFPDEADLLNMTNKNLSFLSIGTNGSDSFLCDAGNGGGSIHSGNESEEPEHQHDNIQDDGSSGHFTEHDSMDITNDNVSHFADENDVQAELDLKERTIQRLQDELNKAQMEMHAKSAKCEKLTEMQSTVDQEIQELTASLFQEAYKMVAESNEKKQLAEKLLKEANGKIEVLEAEVGALKTLVLTSTPSAPNKHLHPQLNSKKSSTMASGPSSSSPKSSSPLAFLGHKRNHSDTGALSVATAVTETEEQRLRSAIEFREIDPIYHREFTSWRERQDPKDKTHPFLKRVYDEEILPCVNFANVELAEQILKAIEDNTIIIEQITDEKPVARTCSLLLVPRICNYRLKLENGGEWVYISALCRNRIASVCDFFTYLRYVQRGLVKSGVYESYWEIIRLRKNIALARMGLGFASS